MVRLCIYVCVYMYAHGALVYICMWFFAQWCARDAHGAQWCAKGCACASREKVWRCVTKVTRHDIIQMLQSKVYILTAILRPRVRRGLSILRIDTWIREYDM